jgi:hypothetical protein
MSSQEATHCAQIQKNFGNREGIYIEKGALRVRISNVRADPDRRWIEAEVEEVPTPGFENSMIHIHLPDQSSPLRWSIGAGFYTTFSENYWNQGHTGWSLFFAPKIVQGIVDLASRWPEDLDAYDRYQQVIRGLEDHDAYNEQTSRAFSE